MPGQVDSDPLGHNVDLERAMRERGATVAVFDDLIEAEADADVILNPAPDIEPEAYRKIAGESPAD